MDMLYRQVLRQYPSLWNQWYEGEGRGIEDLDEAVKIFLAYMQASAAVPASAVHRRIGDNVQRRYLTLIELAGELHDKIADDMAEALMSENEMVRDLRRGYRRAKK